MPKGVKRVNHRSIAKQLINKLDAIAAVESVFLDALRIAATHSGVKKAIGFHIHMNEFEKLMNEYSSLKKGYENAISK